MQNGVMKLNINNYTDAAGQGVARQGKARQGRAGRGMARHGMARHGEAWTLMLKKGDLYETKNLLERMQGCVGCCA